jgi:mRNA (2'-O-methyladenosine-N6-)-methyltransferase
MSPSIHPLPSVPRPAGAVALPSGLGAGGRGKEKAPCRYLHYEVDITPMKFESANDEDEDDAIYQQKETKSKRSHRIELGLGPVGKGYEIVRLLLFRRVFH